MKDDSEGWKKIEANFIRGVICGPLFWMGLIDLGWQGGVNKEAEAFKVTPLGAWLLAAAPQPEIRAEGGRVIVQPNLHITALDPVNDATLVSQHERIVIHRSLSLAHVMLICLMPRKKNQPHSCAHALCPKSPC